MGDRRPYNVEDAIMIDPDTQNNNSPSAQPLSRVVIGEPAEGYNIHQSMIITHNYFEKSTTRLHIWAAISLYFLTLA